MPSLTRSALMVTVLLSSAITPVCAQFIDFEGTGAPCAFGSTSALTTLYSGLGVTFSGGGAIINQCGGFGFLPRSGADFLLLNLNSTYAHGPEVFSFSTPISFFSIFLTTGNLVSSNFLAEAFDMNSQVITSGVFVGPSGGYNEVQLMGSGIESVRITNLGQAHAYAFDDLSFSQETLVTPTPEPASLTLLTTGLLGIIGAARRRNRTQAF